MRDDDATTQRLIPRAVLFGNPERTGAQISPDGRFLSWIAPLDGVMNIWVADFATPDAARAVTHDTHRGIQSYAWTRRPGYLVYIQDENGDENWHIHGLDLAVGTAVNLTPFAGVRAALTMASRLEPGRILVMHNQRDPRFPDLYSLDLATGALSLVAENPGFGGFICDLHFVPRLAFRPTADGGSELMRRNDAEEWAPWIVFSSDDATGFQQMNIVADGSALILRDSRGRNTAALVRIDLSTGVATVIAADDRADIGGVIADLETLEPLAYAMIDAYSEYHALDERIARDIAFLDAQDIGDWSVASRTADDRIWLVGGGSDVRPGIVWIYDREAATLRLLYRSRPALDGMPLRPMTAHRILARDGLSMVSYLTLPEAADADAEARARTRVPLILSVHGGPHARDVHGYNPTHQWLANRGYAVLSVNFRGSSGFGKAHYVAARGEWGGRMDDDLSDAVAWAIERGVADPNRVAIMGASYGGYATLVGLTRNPQTYACGVDIVGPSNLQTLIDAMPPYWEAGRMALYRSLGDPRTEEGKALLRSRSPLHDAAKIVRPLLITQGANDPRVKKIEADQMVAAMKANRVPVTYALFPDEGHGFVRAANRTASNAVIEAFFAQHLGGQHEPIHADELTATSMQVLEGADGIQGLTPVLSAARTA